MNATQRVRANVKTLMDHYGTTKVKLGEVLGGNPEEISQQKFLRAARFLKQSSKIQLVHVERVSDFFGISITVLVDAESDDIISLIKNKKWQSYQQPTSSTTK